MWSKRLILVCFLTFLHSIHGANILFYFGFSSYSHRISAWPLVTALADKGHNVTFFSPTIPKTPHSKVTEFSPKSYRDAVNGILTSKVDLGSRRALGGVPFGIEFWDNVPELIMKMNYHIVNTQEIQDFANSSHFDLVFISGIFNEAGLGFVQKFKAPFILYQTTHPMMWYSDSYGFPEESSSIPHMQYHYPVKMTFFQKVHNTLNSLYWHFFRQWYYLPKTEELVKNGLNIPKNSLSFAEQEKQVSLIFINTHFSEEHSRSLPPLVVPIGGIHCIPSPNEVPQRVPKEMEKFLETAENGFVYISFGSMAKFSTLPLNIRQAFFGAIRRLDKIKFLWKWDAEEIPAEMPNNVYCQTWMPQKEILGHKKIRGFIAHGGLLGIQEAVYHGVPIIALPLFAEQDYNAQRVHETENGLRLELSELTEDNLSDALDKLLFNPKYANNMRRMSKLFKDRKESPVETAVWWTEYVLRNKNIEDLKPLAMSQNWYERRALDIWLFLLCSTLATAFLIFKIIGWLLKIVFSSNEPQKSDRKQRGLEKKDL